MRSHEPFKLTKMPYYSRSPSPSWHSDDGDEYYSRSPSPSWHSGDGDDRTLVHDDDDRSSVNNGRHQLALAPHGSQTRGSYLMTQRWGDSDRDRRLRDREDAENAMLEREAARIREPPRRRAEQARQTSYPTAPRRYVNEGGPGRFLGEDPPDEPSDRHPIASGSRHDPIQREKYIRELGSGDDYPMEFGSGDHYPVRQ